MREEGRRENRGASGTHRLTSAGGQAHTWDASGNFMNDGTSVYAYDPAGRLKTLTQTASIYSFAYNGAGDRLKQIIKGALTTYTLVLNAGLKLYLSENTVKSHLSHSFDKLNVQSRAVAVGVALQRGLVELH